MKIKDLPKSNLASIGSIKCGECFKLEGIFFLKIEEGRTIDLSNGLVQGFDPEQKATPLPEATFCPYGLPKDENKFQTRPEEEEDKPRIWIDAEDFARVANDLSWAVSALDQPAARDVSSYAKAYRSFCAAVILFRNHNKQIL